MILINILEPLFGVAIEVGWNKMVKPQAFGGLGMRQARLMNVSLLDKLVWNILNCPDSLWVQILSS